MKKPPLSVAVAAGKKTSWRPFYLAVGGLALFLGAAAGTYFLFRPSGPAGPPGPAPEGMTWVPAGKFWMGSEKLEFVDARPVHEVELDGFWMDRTEVTNAQFARFVEATGYRTIAERPIDPRDLLPSDATDWKGKDLIPPTSLVFTPPLSEIPWGDVRGLWRPVQGADWRHPEGPESNLDGRENHPVIHVCWLDAEAYARWAGKRLPTEAEWEYAARGGLSRKPYVWGDELKPDNRWMANIWQGDSPSKNLLEDGFFRTAPAATFPANGFGLHDMAGNVWEWCADWYQSDTYLHSPLRNPQGPMSSYDPTDPIDPTIPKRVQRGGSFLCSDIFCSRYMPGGRGKGDPTTGQSHVGFRCVKSAQ